MTLEMLSNRWNPKKPYIDPPGKWKQKRIPGKSWEHRRGGIDGRGEGEGRGEGKGFGEVRRVGWLKLLILQLFDYQIFVSK